MTTQMCDKDVAVRILHAGLRVMVGQAHGYLMRPPHFHDLVRIIAFGSQRGGVRENQLGQRQYSIGSNSFACGMVIDSRLSRPHPA